MLIGAFNPSIFQPSWLAANGLLRKEEAEAATEGDHGFVILREMAAYKAGWLEVQVTENRFSAQTPDPTQYLPLRDLVLGAFRLLGHTRFNQLGINRLMHYKMPSDEEYNALGDFLAPKKAWQGLMDKPGMLSLSIAGPKPGAEKVRYTTKVEPSVRVRPGVFFEMNEHHKADVSDASTTSESLMKILEEQWQSSLDYGRQVPEHVFNAFYGGK